MLVDLYYHPESIGLINNLKYIMCTKYIHFGRSRPPIPNNGRPLKDRVRRSRPNSPWPRLNVNISLAIKVIKTYDTPKNSCFPDLCADVRYD